MKRFFAVFSLLAALAGAAACTGNAPPAPARRLPPVQTKVFELGPLKIDRIFHSMDGPSVRERFDINDIDWVTAFRSEVIDAATGEKLPDRFFCHSQMQLDTETRLLVTATGIPAIEFPEGFGMPLRRILNAMPAPRRGVTLFGMVLNNTDPDIDQDVKVRLTIEYLSFPYGVLPPDLKKLYKVGLPMTREPLTADAGGHDHHDHGGGEMEDGLVEGMKQHWVVPAGRQETRKQYSDVVPVDSTVHYGLVHLHNYATYMKLTDLTDGKVLWETRVVNEPGTSQIAKIPAYSSVTGFPLYKSHQYEIETLYDNTSGGPVDAMAMMYLFYHPGGNEDITYPETPPGAKTSG